MTTNNTASSEVLRRGFLQTSTASSVASVASVASGGLMLGFTVLSNRAQAAGTLYTPDAWVHVADDNTNTILSARSETGQGVSTSMPMPMPMPVAETLNVDLKKTKVAIALVGKAYRNALFGGVQLAGGSTSVRDGWDTLRTAGARLREVLISAAAAECNVDRSTLTARNGTVVGAGGENASCGQLAAAASKL